MATHLFEIKKRAAETHLKEPDLAKRWKVSLRTIQRWRQAGLVPTYLKLGRQISYRLEDVAEYEAAARIRTGVPQ